MFSWAVRGDTAPNESPAVPMPRPPVDDGDLLLHELVESESDPCLLLAPRERGRQQFDFVISHANPAALDLLRLSPVDLGSATLAAVIPSLLARRIPAVCQRVWNSGEACNQPDVLWAASPNAGAAWVDLRVRRLHGHVCVLVLDTTHLHRQQEDLAAGEARYRVLAEKASDIVFRIRGRDRIAWVSPSLHEALGYSQADVVGRELATLIHPDDAPLAACDGEDPHRFDARFRHADGHWTWLSIVTRVEYDDEGLAVGRIGSALDIARHMAKDADLQQTQAQLRAESTRLRAVLDAGLDPQIVLRAVRDRAGRIVDLEYEDCNPAAEVYIGRSRDDLLGQRLTALHSASTVEAGLHSARRVMVTGTPLDIRGRQMICEITGRQRRFDVSMVRLPDGVCVTWRDVT
ncbi:MAG: PAS domain-containing protein [Candidatus Nanopelagicales bacterium]